MFECTTHWWTTKKRFEIDRHFSPNCRKFNLPSIDVFGDVIPRHLVSIWRSKFQNLRYFGKCIRDCHAKDRNWCDTNYYCHYLPRLRTKASSTVSVRYSFFQLHQIVIVSRECEASWRQRRWLLYYFQPRLTKNHFGFFYLRERPSSFLECLCSKSHLSTHM